jgi:hypothetical protein
VLERVDAEGLYKLILADGYKPGTPIRLLVCNWGKHADGLATRISKNWQMPWSWLLPDQWKLRAASAYFPKVNSLKWAGGVMKVFGKP